ncbi:unnamed protein product [Arctogadus glacialis]
MLQVSGGRGLAGVEGRGLSGVEGHGLAVVEGRGLAVVEGRGLAEGRGSSDVVIRRSELRNVTRPFPQFD